MPTKQERIQKLKNQAAEARQIAEAKEEQARQLEVEHRKVQADRNRKDDSRARVLLGVALLLLRNRVPIPSLSTMLAVLIPRDQEFLAQWCKSQEIDFKQAAFDSGPVVVISEPKSEVEFADHKVGDALKNILEGLDEGALGLLAPDILNHASTDQRAVIEPWLAARNGVQPAASDSQSNAPSDHPESGSPHDSSEQTEGSSPHHSRNQPASDSLLQDSDKKPIGENAEVDRNGDLNEEEKLDSGAPIAGGDKNP